MAKDNGRSTEFVRRREYPDKSHCYECGEQGHLSYQCTKNTLGVRTPPAKKVRVRKKKTEETTKSMTFYDSDEEVEDSNKEFETGEPFESELSMAIRLEVSKTISMKRKNKKNKNDKMYSYSYNCFLIIIECFRLKNTTLKEDTLKRKEKVNKRKRKVSHAQWIILAKSNVLIQFK